MLYDKNEIKIITTTSPGSSSYVLNTIDNDRVIKSEQYQMSSINQKYYLSGRSHYTYENDKIIVNNEPIGTDNTTVFTYYFNSDHNLIKSEELTKYKGVNRTLSTFVYSDFDNSKNPFKKMWFINYRKSLSANNYRTLQYTYTDFNSGFTDPTLTYHYIYKYDADGQLLLYHPL